MVQTRNAIDNLFNYQDEHIYLPGSSDMFYLKQIGQYYFLTNKRTGKTYNDTGEAPKEEFHSIDVEKYILGLAGGANYVEKKYDFYSTYAEADLADMRDAICVYGAEFHSRFVEDVIEYVFLNLTVGSKDGKYHEFYYKMLYYYDTVGLVLFANSVKEYVYEEYKDYIAEAPQEIEVSRETRQIVNMTMRQLRLPCSWCPDAAKEEYVFSLKNALSRSIGAGKADPAMLPVGHFLRKEVRLFIPSKGWYGDKKYVKPATKWVENPIIVGMNIKSDTGLHVRFKLREPHASKSEKDGRTTKTGVQCGTMSKKVLEKICKDLGAVYTNTAVATMCDAIKTRLLYLELVERYAGSNIKYMYSQFEDA